jgi:CRP/FNR family cyclic AMP-dependent transcriptional regulator
MGDSRLLEARLKQSPLFSGMPPETLERIASVASSRICQRGDILARELSASGHFILLLEGTLEISRRLQDGTRAVFRTLHPPAEVGYLLLSGQPHTADVVAAEPAAIALIPVPALKAEFDADPRLFLKAITRLAGLVDELSTELIELRTLPLQERLRAAILRNADDRGELRLSHEELAELVGATRSSVTRGLRELASCGVIALGRRVIRLTGR